MSNNLRTCPNCRMCAILPEQDMCHNCVFKEFRAQEKNLIELDQEFNEFPGSTEDQVKHERGY